MNKVIFQCFCAFALFKQKIADGVLSVNEQTELIKSVTDELNSKFIIILTDNLDTLTKEILLEKTLNVLLELYTAIWDFETFTRQLHSGVIPNLKTLVVMKHDNSYLKKLSLISKRFSLAPFDWLVLSTYSLDLEYHFKGIIIPINCRFLASTRKENGFVTIFELYRISWESELIQIKFATWSLETGLDGLKTDIFNRRMNLRGLQLKYAVHDLSSGINPCRAVHMDNGKQMVQCANYDIWNALGGVLNYTTEYVLIEDCYKKGNTGLSTPMLEMIRTGGADSGEDGYIWSSSRLIHNQFFWPLYHSKVILVSKVPYRKFSFSSYVRPFDGNMWLALITWLLLSGVVILFIKFIVGRYLNSKKIQFANEGTENLFLPLAAICYQSSSSIPKKAVIRITYLMIYLVPVLLIPSYSGSIISSLSVPSEDVPFSDLEEFEQDGTYQLNAINNTYFQIFLMTDDTFESLRHKKLVSNTMTVSYEQSFRDICSKRVTFLYEWPLLTKYSINCNVFKFELSLKRIFSSMAVSKNFPYLELFNRQIQKLITSGLNNKILEKNTLELFKHEVNPFPDNYFQLKPFELEDVLPLFAVLGAGISVSLLILLFEKRVRKLNIKK